jgi:hypothetical protein
LSERPPGDTLDRKQIYADATSTDSIGEAMKHQVRENAQHMFSERIM